MMKKSLYLGLCRAVLLCLALALLAGCAQNNESPEADDGLTVPYTVGQLTFYLPEGWTEELNEIEPLGERFMSHRFLASRKASEDQLPMVVTISYVDVDAFDLIPQESYQKQLADIRKTFAKQYPDYEVTTQNYYTGNSCFAAYYLASPLAVGEVPFQAYPYILHESGVYHLDVSSWEDPSDFVRAFLRAAEFEGEPLGLEPMEIEPEENS